jgi:hypothetical protein
MDYTLLFGTIVGALAAYEVIRFAIGVTITIILAALPIGYRTRKNDLASTD